MQQLEIFDIASPCIGICQSDSRGYCLGCHRSREERFAWQSYNPAQKRLVLLHCSQRARRKPRAVTNNDENPAINAQGELFL